MAENLKFLKGSSNNWASMPDKSPNVFYVVQYGDDNFVEKYELYLGDKLIGDGTSLLQINNMLAQYATKAELTQGLLSKQDKGNYATMEQLSNKLDMSIYNSEKESFALKDDLGTKTDAADKNGSAFAQINWVKNELKYAVTPLESITGETVTLKPNIHYVGGELANLRVELQDFIVDDRPNRAEYSFEFLSGDNPTTLSLPNNIIWANNNPPVIKATTSYEFNIVPSYCLFMVNSDIVYYGVWSEYNLLN